jgi:hypothetical protein
LPARGRSTGGSVDGVQVGFCGSGPLTGVGAITSTVTAGTPLRQAGDAEFGIRNDHECFMALPWPLVRWNTG